MAESGVDEENSLNGEQMGRFFLAFDQARKNFSIKKSTLKTADNKNNKENTPKRLL